MASIRERNGKFNVIYSYTNEKGERRNLLPWLKTERSNAGYAGCFNRMRCVKGMVVMNENDKRN